MHRPKLGSAVLLAAFAAASFIPLTAIPAGAVTTSGCKNSVFAGAELGWYAAYAGSQSELRVACIFDSRSGSSLVSAKFAIHDAKNIQYHNGAARTVLTATATAASSTCIDLTSKLGLLAYINHTVTGGPFSAVLASTGLVARTFETSITTAGGLRCDGITALGAQEARMNLNTATGGTVIPAATALRIDNSDSRTSVNGATTFPGGFSIACADCNFNPAVGEIGTIGGSNIPNYTWFVSTGAGTADLCNIKTASPCPVGNRVNATNGYAHGGETIDLKGDLLTSTNRNMNDVTCTAPGTVNSAAAAFSASDVGLPFYSVPCGAASGTGYYITAVGVGTATVSNAAGTPLTTTAVKGRGVVGDASITAPADNEMVMTQAVQLDLDPGLVAGSDDCALDTPEGFGTVGKWRGPGIAVAPLGFFENAFGTQEPDTKAIGEIIFTTAVVSFGAFIVERESGAARTAPLPADPIGPKHYDIVFSNVPTGLALCSTATSPGLGLSIGVPITTPSVAALASGLGKPGSAQLRNTAPKSLAIATCGTVVGACAGTFNSTIFMYDDNNPRIWLPAANFNRLCVIPADPAAVAFTCGDG